MSLLSLALFVLAAQQPDPAKVDAAIKKGVDFLRKSISHESHQSCEHPIADSDELILWTYVHAGIAESDPELQRLLQKILASELQRTYEVALQAMILEELDRVKHQHRIAQCGQFLADNQCKNGQWSYGEPSPFVRDVPTTGTPRKEIATSGRKPVKPPPGVRIKPAVTTRISVQKKRDGKGEGGVDTGDNSNSQYAALGLRACHDAGIVFPQELLRLAVKWWRESQRDEGWGYEISKKKAHGSMTAGGAGSLVILDYILGEPWRKDPEVLKGLKWLGENFTVKQNPFGENGPKHAVSTHYYLYALERAGILYVTDTFGAHDWYVEGARWLLETQRADGAWLTANTKGSRDTWDTCFAILFLRRATRPLLDVPTEDRHRR